MTTQDWRGVATENSDDLPSDAGIFLRARSRRLLGELLRPHRRSLWWLLATVVAQNAAWLAGPLLIGVAGGWKSSGTGIDVCLDVTLNGARIGHATYGVTFLQSIAANLYLPVAWSQVRALAAGTYTLKLQYRTSSGTLSLGPLSATQFYAIELL